MRVERTARSRYLKKLVVSDGHAKLLPLVSVVESDVAAGLHDANRSGGQNESL